MQLTRAEVEAVVEYIYSRPHRTAETIYAGSGHGRAVGLVHMKYKNVKTTVDGIAFDSQKEAKRFGDLKLMQKAGEISDLTLQPKFDIVINGVKVCSYVADFSYIENGVKVVEDVKSEVTRKLPTYRLKNKLMRAVHGIAIREI